MSATLERVAREAAPGERAAVIALTLASYEQYDAITPPGAWPLYAAAIRIYQRLGFARATEHDFQSQSGVLVMGFRLDLIEAHT